jgi:8-oxo-dGTP diphosphatase
MPLRFKISEKPFDFEKPENGSQSFRWANLTETTYDELSFPIDKVVFQQLIQDRMASA